jgi:hypothetical protein
MVRKIARIAHRLILVLLLCAAALCTLAWLASYRSSPLEFSLWGRRFAPPPRHALHLAVVRGELTARISRLVSEFPQDLRPRFKGWRIRDLTENAPGFRSVTLSRGRPNHRSFGLFDLGYQWEWVILESRIATADFAGLREFVFQHKMAEEPGIVCVDVLASQVRFTFPLWVLLFAMAGYPAALLAMLCLRRVFRNRSRPPATP